MQHGENKAIEITDKLAPYLVPMPSDNEQLIRTAAEFALEINPLQNFALTRLELLVHDPLLPAVEATKIGVFIKNFERRNRYHKAKEYVADIMKFMSFYGFARDESLMQTTLNKKA